jgi:DNA-binding response OmpR family regulator
MSRPVVAVIEDDPSLRTSLARLLRAKGYACETCGAAEEFLDHFVSSRASCVLIDINFGSGLSGIALCKRLKAFSADSSATAYVPSGADQLTLDTAIDVSADLVLTEPH